MVLPPCRKFGASLSVITKRSLSVPSGASWIAKAVEVLAQALIPDHEKLALKAEAACIEVSRSTAANPKALGNWRIFDPFPTVGQNRRFSNRDNTYPVVTEEGADYRHASCRRGSVAANVRPLIQPADGGSLFVARATYPILDDRTKSLSWRALSRDPSFFVTPSGP